MAAVMGLRSTHSKDKATLLMLLITVATTGNSVTGATAIVEERSSECSDLKEQTLEFLDRQNVECGADEAISSFLLTADDCSNNDMHYEYGCLSISSVARSLESAADRETDCSQMRGETLEFLDRQAVACLDGEVLQSFKVTGDDCSNNDMRYAYSCAALSSAAELGTPKTKDTSCTEMSTKRILYLDRQTDIACSDGEAMLSFRVVTDDCSGNDKKFRITCAEVNPSVCSCNDGTAATGAQGCANDGDETCAICEGGFHLTEADLCAANICTCSNGTGETGADCVNDSTETCASCDDGFHISSDTGACTGNVCSCNAGTAATGADCVNNSTETCASCDDGFHISSDTGVCAGNVCSCNGGTAATGADCANNSTETCASCNDGYYFTDADTCAAGAFSSCLSP